MCVCLLQPDPEPEPNNVYCVPESMFSLLFRVINDDTEYLFQQRIQQQLPYLHECCTREKVFCKVSIGVVVVSVLFSLMNTHTLTHTCIEIGKANELAISLVRQTRLK